MRIAEELRRLEAERHQLEQEVLKIQREVSFASEKAKAEAESYGKLPDLQQKDNVRIVKPKIKYNPPYPRRALRMGLEGKVKVRMLVGRDGKVCAVTVLESVPKGEFEKTVVLKNGQELRSMKPTVLDSVSNKSLFSMW